MQNYWVEKQVQGKNKKKTKQMVHFSSLPPKAEMIFLVRLQRLKNHQFQNDCNQMRWWWHGLEELTRAIIWRCKILCGHFQPLSTAEKSRVIGFNYPFPVVKFNNSLQKLEWKAMIIPRWNFGYFAFSQLSSHLNNSKKYRAFLGEIQNLIEWKSGRLNLTRICVKMFVTMNYLGQRSLF